ncbi:MAG: cell wall-binding repeat-containing protein [Chloroflexi bacterium]|nr:cell wall-binding repeat-containing protein [Chloroflexota bacterium]
MQHAVRALVVALLTGLLAVAPVAAGTTGGAGGTSVTPAAAGDPVLSTAKVVIIVGATHSATSHYRDIANSAYAEAIKHSSNVVKIYSPNATWSVVKPALQGASVVVYLGHGNGWPSPYTYDPNFTTKDGFGLNASANNGDNNTKYYGEPYIANEIDLAPNAVVLLNHLCYASGNSEPGYAAPSLSVAMQRVDNYGAAFIKAGARAVIAEGHGSINGMIRDLFTTHQTVVDLWRNQNDYNGNEFSFQSSRSPAYRAFMDPDSPSGGFYRSLVGSPDVRTEDVTGVPFTPTDTTPETLQSPGAATVAPGGVTLYENPDLTNAGGSLPDGATVRVQDLAVDTQASGTPSAAYVREKDGWASGWAAADALAPQDSSSPQLWGIDGSRTISPNGDGKNDTLNLTISFSEAVDWNLEIRDGWDVVWEASGSGDQAEIAWDAKVDGAALDDGAYSIAVAASDEWGNDPLDTNVSFIVDTSLQDRLAGKDRYSTAAAISAATFSPGVDVAYLATGANFPDALAGAAAAGMQHAPILLVTRDAIPVSAAAELLRLQPKRIVILGSTAVVSSAVGTEAGDYTAGEVTRIAGADRYATAAAISAATFAPGVSIAYVATGANFPDALAGAAVAGSRGAPVLLVAADKIPSVTVAELKRLKPAKIVVLGGASVVSSAVKDALGAYTAGSVIRLAGSDRYSTAATISSASFAPGVDVVYVATGANFPDALAGAAAAGSEGAPIVLVTKDTIPGATATELQRLDPGRIVVLGSTGVVSEAVRIQLQLLLGG